MFTLYPIDSVIQNGESEIVALNIIKILKRSGDKFRELSWPEYEAERKKDGGFSENEKDYFYNVQYLCKGLKKDIVGFSSVWANSYNKNLDLQNKQLENENKKPLQGIKAANFTTFCQNKTIDKIKNALRFYNRPFKAEEVPEFFLNWTLKYDDSIYRDGVLLTNKHSTEKWSCSIMINDDAEYCFGYSKKEDRLSLQWQYTPKTLSEFISDCLRYGDIDLVLSQKAIDMITKFDDPLEHIYINLKAMPGCPAYRKFKSNTSGDFFHSITDKEMISGMFYGYKFSGEFIKSNPDWFKRTL